MAPPKTKKPPLLSDEELANANNEDIDFSAELIKQINKEAGNRIAFNLGTDDAPTNIKRWISTGSKQLDYIVSNRPNGGLAEGRIIEIQGPASSGKSHVAYEIAKSTQNMGGIVVYIDTENATSVENLETIGIDIRKKFVFIQETCIEEIFKVIESTIEKARNLKADVPVTIIWDSVAASAPKAEIEGDYDQNTIGLAARVLSKGFRKITHVIGDKNVCLVLLNQQRQKIGVLYGDPSCVSPDTNLVVRRSVNKNKTSEMIKFAELFNHFGVDKFDTPLEIDTTSDEYEIESWDEKTQQTVWKPISALVVKPSVQKHYKLGALKGTSVHRVLYNGQWTELQNHPEAVLVEEPMTVVDMMVEDTENYLAEGQINHNTTPGGMAIPYHASTRIKLTGGQQIKQTINGKEAVVGINVTCKTIKNKVARPWREVSFEIHFGKGIREDEQLFDELREYCEKCKDPVIVEGMKVKVDGAGAWKYFMVTDNKTGEVVHDLKFNKSAFREKVINNPEVQVYLTGLMDAVFIMGNGDENHKTIASIDLNSAAEVEAVKVERTIKAGKNLLLD